MEEPRFDPFDYVSAFQRRKWWFIVPVAASVVVGLMLVWLLPRTYQSSAMLGVSNPRVEANLIGGASVNRSERLRAISQQLLSRPVLERAVQLERLNEQEPLDEAIARLRSGLEIALGESAIKGSLTPDQRAALDAYRVSYTGESPDAAQRLLSRVVTVFVEENNRQRQMRAQDTSSFIAGQLRESEERLAALEAKLRQAKEAYMGRLPEQRDANLQMVANLQRQLESTATMMVAEQGRLSMLDRQIESMEQGADVGPINSSGVPSGNLQSRALALRAELAEAQLRFTDKHPEVIRLKEELATAEKAASAERARPVSDRLEVLQTNPEYRQLRKERETLNLRIAQLRRQHSQAESGIRQYESRVEAAPRVEQELVSLQRAYELERAAHSDLTEKRQAALLNEELQRSQGDERFAVIAGASFPDTPFSPKPMRVLLMALAAGFVLGAAGVMGREYLDRSVHDARGLRDEFELPVLAEIPRIDPVIS